jgi:PLP dependent protein
MISENLKKVEARIEEICQKCGRNRSEIKLIAVSKTQPAEVINEALNSGLKEFGENKALELRDKSELIKGDFRWHFIGHLQSNKVKYIINSADYIHAVDSIKLADEINRKAAQLNKKQKILIEIKTSGETAKLGLESEKEIFEVAEFCSSHANLDLKGLMTMAPFTDDANAVRSCFIKLRKMKETFVQKGFSLTELSMGMTNDFDIAIEEGATMIRIGTALFGNLPAGK